MTELHKRSEKAMEALRKKAQECEFRRRKHEENIEGFEIRLGQLETNIQVYHEARQLFIEASKFTREKTIADVEKTVTAALHAIFNDPTLSFGVNVVERRSALEADFVVRFEVNGEMTEVDPLDAKGGSLVDVITTALRLVFLKSHRPQKRQILVLDEPGKFLDHERRMRFGTWLAKISHDLGVQLIIITHDEELMAVADRTFELRPGGSAGVKVKVIDA
jgi:DNA repair exonuclease SbcCD ATPase subunit